MCVEGIEDLCWQPCLRSGSIILSLPGSRRILDRGMNNTQPSVPLTSNAPTGSGGREDDCAHSTRRRGGEGYLPEQFSCCRCQITAQIPAQYCHNCLRSLTSRSTLAQTHTLLNLHTHYTMTVLLRQRNASSFQQGAITLLFFIYFKAVMLNIAKGS